MNATDPRHHTRGGRASVLLVHPMGGPDSQLQKGLAAVAKKLHPFSGRHLAPGPLSVQRLHPPTETDLSLLRLQTLDGPLPMLQTILEPSRMFELAFDHRHDLNPPLRALHYTAGQSSHRRRAHSPEVLASGP